MIAYLFYSYIKHMFQTYPFSNAIVNVDALCVKKAARLIFTCCLMYEIG